MHATIAVRPVETEEFDEIVLKNDRPVVVDFWASWCGPCRRLAPSFEALARELSATITFLSVNVDAEPALAQRFAVLSIPTIKFFRSGREVATHVGGGSTDELRDLVRDWLRYPEPVGAGS